MNSISNIFYLFMIIAVIFACVVSGNITSLFKIIAGIVIITTIFNIFKSMNNSNSL